MEQNRNYCVYMHIVTANQKKYVGQTCQNVNDRWQNGHGYDSMLFGKAIKKYGWENIEHYIIYDNLTKDEADIKEMELIQLYSLQDPRYGYNRDSGGSRGVPCELTKEKISESGKMAKQHKMKPVYKYTLSGEYIDSYESINDASRKTGIDSRAISSCCNGYQKSAKGYQWSYEKKDKIDIVEGLKKEAKPVCQYTTDDVCINIYNSIAEAERMTGINFKNISSCCLGQRKTAGGYIWRYLTLN